MIHLYELKCEDYANMEIGDLLKAIREINKKLTAINRALSDRIEERSYRVLREPNVRYQ